MKKTTIYLPEELKRALERMADQEGCSEAMLVRETLRQAIRKRQKPRPRIPLTGGGLGDESTAERVDEILAGFGSDAPD